MGVYIPNMEIPKRCAECRMAAGDTLDGFCHAAEMWFDDDRWRWFVYGEDDIDTDRPLNCPLISVPPHGRLIDADALQNRIRKCKREDTMTPHNLMVYREFLFAPTIIPAEPCNDLAKPNNAPTVIGAEDGDQ